jgi:hypothetical protein
MICLLKCPGYRLCPPDSPEAGALLAEQGLGPADPERALARLESTKGTAIRTIVGINEDGAFGTGCNGWRPDLPDACHEPFIPLLWVKVHEPLLWVMAGCPRAARHGSSGTARYRTKLRATPLSTGWPAESLDSEAPTA